MQQKLSHPQYRPDIDGLRAVGVLSVVAFHAFPEILNGGFIGVDIFFVISGYLISTIIFDNLLNQTFSFHQFYARRIKRIFPALLIVLLATSLFGWLFLFPDEYKALCKHVIAGGAFVSNFALWQESGYFDTAAETKPLLHLWSLGIEEQFYILWPLLLWICWKIRINFFALIIGGMVVSYILNTSIIASDPIAAFYSPATRIWELLFGGLLAWLKLAKITIRPWTTSESTQLQHQFSERGKFSSHLPDALSIFGTSILLYGFVYITKNDPFPGQLALIPVVGTAMIIYAGKAAWINRVILSNPVAIWFGLISFPLYLWHWPLLSFLQIVEGDKATHFARFIAVAIATFLAWITYRFIERPVRFSIKVKHLSPILACAMVCVTCSAAFIGQQYSIASGIKGDIGHQPFFEFLSKHYKKCADKTISESSGSFEGHVRCYQSGAGEPDIILLGDSHAEHLFVGLAESLADRNVAFYVQQAVPTLYAKEFGFIFERIQSYKETKYILLTNYYFSDYLTNKEQLHADFSPTIRALIRAGHRVALVGDVPRFDRQPSECVSNYQGHHLRKIDKDACLLDSTAAKSQVDIYDDGLRSMSKEFSVPYIPIHNHICLLGRCSMIKDGVLMYRDNHHLNIEGSRLIGTRLAEELRSMKFFDVLS